MNNSYMNYLISTKKSENTIKNYIKYVNSFCDFVDKPDEEITYLDIINYQASISNLSANSIRIQLTAIKSYFKFLYKIHVINNNPAEDIEKPKAYSKEKPYITEEDAIAMVNNARSIRDKAMIKFMITTGVRISELINITIEDYRKALNHNREIEIIGKGRKNRKIYIGSSVEESVNDYLRTREDNTPYLFVTYRGTQIDIESFSKTLKATARRANLPYWKDICNHAMRAGAATIMNDKGVNIAVISKALGHSSLKVTTTYIKTTQAKINNAMEVINF